MEGVSYTSNFSVSAAAGMIATPVAFANLGGDGGGTRERSSKLCVHQNAMQLAGRPLWVVKAAFQYVTITVNDVWLLTQLWGFCARQSGLVGKCVEATRPFRPKEKPMLLVGRKQGIKPFACIVWEITVTHYLGHQAGCAVLPWDSIFWCNSNVNRVWVDVNGLGVDRGRIKGNS